MSVRKVDRELEAPLEPIIKVEIDDHGSDASSGGVEVPPSQEPKK